MFHGGVIEPYVCHPGTRSRSQWAALRRAPMASEVATGAHTCLSSPTVSSSLVEDQLRPVTTSECFFDECSATLSSTIDKGAGKERGPRPDVERHQKYAG